MNKQNLGMAEKKFLNKYPGGFDHPVMQEIGKRHRMEKMTKLARQCFTEEAFNRPAQVIDDMVKLTGRSSMVSVFEKPRFRDFVRTLDSREKSDFSESLYEILHGKQATGFEMLVDQLARHKLAKWTLATVVPAYYRPARELLVKPNTTKLIIDRLDLDLEYKPRPSWAFYRDYRKAINNMKKDVDKRLAPSNPAFCGFLMMGLEML